MVEAEVAQAYKDANAQYPSPELRAETQKALHESWRRQLFAPRAPWRRKGRVYTTEYPPIARWLCLPS